ncbi:MAG TPA: O-antigen ligase family protein [Nitrospira sp.]|nr:O-antigen ligase family protein [Nitrospira sp.]HNG53380.1 O-antigen ligase family protein [Nitrospira sp.]
MEVWLFYGIMFAGAMIAAITIVLSITLGLQVRVKWQNYTLPILIALLGINMALSPILNGRDLRLMYTGVDFLPTGYQSALAAYVAKLFSYLAILAAFVEVAHHFVKSKRTIGGQERTLITALVLYFAAAFALPGLLGERRGLEHFHFYPPLIFSALYLSCGNEPERVAKIFRNTIAGVLLASLAVAAVHPDMVLQFNFRGAIPLFDFRFWGLAAHPNAFAPLALTFLILLKSTPYKRQTLNIAAWAIGVGAVLTAQSKTVWLIALTLLAANHVLRIVSELGKRSASAVSVGVVGGSALLVIGFLAVMIAWSLGLTTINLKFMNEIDTKSLSTLTGRDLIWELTLKEWRNSPAFGYGLNLWGEEYRRLQAMPSAFHAHNQFVQTLGSGGVVGLTGLIGYLCVLFWGSTRVVASFRPIAFTLILMLMIRSFSEPPFEMKSIGDANMMMHLCLFALIVSSIRTGRKSQ